MKREREREEWRRDAGGEGEAERGDVFESGTFLPLYVHL